VTDRQIYLAGHDPIWDLTDRFSRVQGAPLVTDPDTGKRIDPMELQLQYRWYLATREWRLLIALVDGVQVVEDGTYPNSQIVRCTYDDPDPQAGEDEAGFPAWVLDIANDRLPYLPEPPPA